MRITVRLFASARENAGLSQLAIDLPDGANVALAAKKLNELHPGLGSSVAFAVNRTYARGDAVLNDGDELAIIPPVSGG